MVLSPNKEHTSALLTVVVSIRSFGVVSFLHASQITDADRSTLAQEMLSIEEGDQDSKESSKK